MQTNHRIIAQPFHIKAAATNALSKLILPLEGGWFAGDPAGWPPIELAEVAIKEGDRVFLAEPWFEHDDGFALRSLWVKDLNTYLDDSEWDPAETMPSQAAKFWFEIRVVEIFPLAHFVYKGAGLYCSGLSQETSTMQDVVDRWNAAYSKYPWHGDRPVVVLDLVKVNHANP
jgi:hypothetical protein